jgi:cyclase
MSRTLIVARIRDGSEEAVKHIFAESDTSELPRMLGVRERRLYHFHDLYFHSIESDEDLALPLAEVRAHPLFADINNKLSEHITAYDPATWRSPSDAMAREFYFWRTPA